jgi:zinc transporter ZupT
LLLLDRCMSHRRASSPSDDNSTRPNSLKRAWLFVWAVALHNLPEGLAIGVAYAGVDVDKANSLATGISIQDVPEGLVVALALRTVGYGRAAVGGARRGVGTDRAGGRRRGRRPDRRLGRPAAVRAGRWLPARCCS